MTQYSRGRTLEYKIKKQLEDEGNTVLRTAGSHGPYDLISIAPDGKIRLIQLKRRKTGASKTEIETYNTEVSKEFWVVVDTRGNHARKNKRNNHH